LFFIKDSYKCKIGDCLEVGAMRREGWKERVKGDWVWSKWYKCMHENRMKAKKIVLKGVMGA
jgi:hypothetical protein